MQPLFKEEDKNALKKYIDSDAWFTEHEVTRSFETQVSDFTKSKYCIAVNNGTISLTLILQALGIGPGDEYIVPNYTMIATANCGIPLGAKPVFVDVEEETFCIDIKQVEKSITSQTKALLFVNANGRYPTYPIQQLIDLCKNYGLYFIEDAAQGLGSYYPDGTHVGTLGIAGSLSFSMPKIITTGQGGMILTDNEDLATKFKALKNFGRSEGGLDIHDTIGYNYKITDIQATLGVTQMKQLPERIVRKKEIYNRYWANLLELSQKGVALFKSNDVQYTAPWFYELMVENDKRDELKMYLKSKGIGSRDMYPPINEQVAYQVAGNFPVSKKIGRTGLWIPSFVQLTNEEIDYVSEIILKFFTNK